MINTIDAVCIWDPVYRLQFIGLGRVGVGRGEIDYVRRKMLLMCVCFSSCLSCQRKLDYLCSGFGIRRPLRGLTCTAACGLHMGGALASGSPKACVCAPSYGHPCPQTLPVPPKDSLPLCVARAWAKDACVDIHLGVWLRNGGRSRHAPFHSERKDKCCILN